MSHPRHHRPAPARAAVYPQRPQERDANYNALLACEGPHDFALVRARGDGASRAQYRCRRCGGTMSESMVRAYWSAARHIFAAMERRDVEALRRLREQAAAAAPEPAP